MRNKDFLTKLIKEKEGIFVLQNTFVVDIFSVPQDDKCNLNVHC